MARTMWRRAKNHFNKLSDFFLIIIVSFLPFKEAARTCILSKRWRNIWRCTGNVEFSESFFVPNILTHPDTGEPYSETQLKDIQRRAFFEFIRNWMHSYNKPEVRRFCLSLSYPYEFLEVEDWIKFFVDRKVKELELDFSNDRWQMGDQAGLFQLPTYVYEHASLKSLKLSACNFDISRIINFQGIKEISLGCIELLGASLNHLIANCNFLEVLSLKKCRNLDSISIILQGLKLRSLSIEDCSPLRYGITLSCPTLRFFKYFGLLQHFILEDLNSLEEAELDFGLEKEYNLYGDWLYEILSGLKSAKVLKLCSYLTQVIPTVEEATSIMLSEVGHLTLKLGVEPSEFQGIFFMLKSCPFLETLSIRMGAGMDLEGSEDAMEFNNPETFWRDVSCLRLPSLRCIKVVEVHDFRGTPHELVLLSYLLTQSQGLQRMIVNTWKGAGPSGVYSDLYQQKLEPLLRVNEAYRKAILTIQ